MVVDYKSRKNEVLSSYEIVEDLVTVLKNNAQRVGMPDPLERVDTLLTDIRTKAEKVRADRFCLMVAGESKSGKSTFINAYLGVELLPMDVKQCTSAIVEIKYGKEFCVRATYADGRKQEIKGDESARDFLIKNAALDDEYRDIPVPTINHDILITSGVRAKSKGIQINISKADVEALLNAPDVQEANIHNMPVADYNNKIRDYIDKKKNNWHNIVKKIEVFFPFGKELRGIEIIDSPGVCARGGVAEFTSQYIESADAIIFLKPVSGQALESTQFNQFLRNASVERNKNALFLVLTRATNVTSADLRRLEDEAYKQFSNMDKDNILLVDSKAELYAKKLSSVDDVEAELRNLNKSGTLDDFVVKAWTDTSGLFGEGDKGDFIKVLQEKSRFKQIYDALETFGRKAHYLLLGALLDAVCRLYTKLYSDLETQIDLFRQKAENPSELAKKIANIKEDLTKIEIKMNDGVGEVWERFRGNDGIIISSTEESVKSFERQLSEIDANSGDSFSEIERIARDKADELVAFKKNTKESFVKECNEKLVTLNDSEIPTESIEPDIEAIIGEVKEDISKRADETISNTTGWACFEKTTTVPKYSKPQLFKIMKNDFTTRLDNIKEDIIRELGTFVDSLRSSYLNELNGNFAAKTEELNAIVKAKATAEETLKHADELAVLQTRISEAKTAAIKIRGGIEDHV